MKCRVNFSFNFSIYDKKNIWFQALIAINLIWLFLKKLNRLFYIDRSSIIFNFYLYLSIGYHDTGAYPAPTFYNPIPWHPNPIPKTQKTERPKSRTRSKKYVWNPQKYFWELLCFKYCGWLWIDPDFNWVHAFECRYQDFSRKAFQILDICFKC